MIFHFNSLARPARAAKVIRDSFAVHGVEVGLCRAQAIAAQAYGYGTYRQMKRAVGRHPASPWDSLLDQTMDRIHHHADVFEAAGLTRGDAWHLATTLRLTAKRFPFKDDFLGGVGSAGPLAAKRVAADPLVSMGLTKAQARQLRDARRDRQGIFLIGGPSWGWRDTLVETLLHEPGPRPMGGHRRRSGAIVPSLDEAFDAARSAGYGGTALDFGHNAHEWRDGRMLAAVEGGAQAWMTMHPENLFTLDRHFQGMLSGRDREWEQPDVVRAQSRMACLIGFMPVRRTCGKCSLNKAAFLAKYPDQADYLASSESDLGFAYPETVRFIDRDGCGRCDRGVEGHEVVASLMLPDEWLNALLLKRQEASPNFHDREVFDAWRERGGLTMEEVTMAKMLSGFVDPLCGQSCLLFSDCEPTVIRNALTIVRDEGWEVAWPPRTLPDRMSPAVECRASATPARAR